MILTIVIVCLFLAMAVLSFFSNVIRALLTAFFNLLTAFFNLFRRKGGRSGGKSTEGRQTVHTSNSRKKKVYSKDDGEYVDFEEVK